MANKLATDIKDAYCNARERVKSVKKRVWVIIGLALIAAFFVFGFTARYIFGPPEKSGITRAAEEGIADVINVVKIFQGQVPTILNSISVIFVGLIIIGILLLITHAFGKGSNRSKTVFSLIGSFIKYIGAIVILISLLGLWGVDTVTLVAGLGILGLIIGLGAQGLVGDILAGVFIVFENNFQVGDIVTIDSFRGEVLEIGVRTTRIKSPLGDVKVITNSDIRTIINMSRLPSFALVDVIISYGEDLEKAEKILKGALAGFAKKLPVITATPEYLGVYEFSSRGVVMRFKAQCQEQDRLQLARDLNREIKLLLDKNKIKIAVEQLELKSKGK